MNLEPRPGFANICNLQGNDTADFPVKVGKFRELYVLDRLTTWIPSDYESYFKIAGKTDNKKKLLRRKNKLGMMCFHAQEFLVNHPSL